MEVHSGSAVSLYCATYWKLAFTNSLFECLFFSKQEREKDINHCLNMIFMIFFLLPYCMHVVCFALSIRIPCVSIFPHFSPLQCVLLDQFYFTISILSLLTVPQLLCLSLRIR